MNYLFTIAAALVYTSDSVPGLYVLIGFFAFIYNADQATTIN